MEPAKGGRVTGGAGMGGGTEALIFPGPILSASAFLYKKWNQKKTNNEK
jgi:hypothetical protein